MRSSDARRRRASARPPRPGGAASWRDWLDADTKRAVDDAVKRDAEQFRAQLASLRAGYEGFPAYQQALDASELVWKASREVAYRVFFADHRATWTARMRAMAEANRVRLRRFLNKPVGGGARVSLRAVLAATHPEGKNLRSSVLDELRRLIREFEETIGSAVLLHAEPDRRRGLRKAPEPLRFSAYQVATYLQDIHPTVPASPRAAVVVRETFLALRAGGWQTTQAKVGGAIDREYRARRRD
jgi:hypothetical protein